MRAWGTFPAGVRDQGTPQPESMEKCCFVEANRTDGLCLNDLCVMRGVVVSGCHKEGYLVLVTKAGSPAGDKWGCLCSKNGIMFATATICKGKISTQEPVAASSVL